MRNLTPAFQQELENGNRQYICEVETDIEIGTSNETLTFTNAELWASGLSVTDDVSSSDSSFEALGSVCVGALRVVVSNIDEDYTDIVFEGATFVPYVGLEINGSVERIKLGTYKVEEVTYNGALISFYCLDNLSKFDKPVPSNMVGTSVTATLGTIVSAVCTQCGVILDTPTFPNYTYAVTIPTYESITYREVLSYCAAIAGCFVKCSANGHVVLDWFDVSSLAEAQEEIEEDTYEGDVAGVHNFESLASQNLGIEDVVITGIQITIKNPDENAEQDVLTYTYGTSDYVIKIEDNPFITTANVATIGAYLQSRLVGLTFRYGSISILNSPAIEAGDVCVVKDRKGKYYSLLITNTEFTVGSYQNISSAADTPARNLANRFSSSTKSFVEAKQMVKQEADARDTLEQDLTQAINAKSGMYETREPVGTSGAYIYYLHDKPNLNDPVTGDPVSKVVMKVTNEAVAVTPDYQATPVQWYGLTVDGNFIANIMSVIGIDFDWGTGGTLTLGGQNNVNGTLTILDANGQSIGSWNNNGILLTAGSKFNMVAPDGRNVMNIGVINNSSGYASVSLDVANPNGQTVFKTNLHGLVIPYQVTSCVYDDDRSDVGIPITIQQQSDGEYAFVFQSAPLRAFHLIYSTNSLLMRTKIGTKVTEGTQGISSILIGTENDTYYQYSIAIGNLISNTHTEAFAIGLGLETTGNYQTILGRFNDTDEDGIFAIGSGTGENNRQNIFSIDRAGYIHFVGGMMTNTAVNIYTNCADPSDTKRFLFATDGGFVAPGIIIAHDNVYATDDTRYISLKIDSDGQKAGLWDTNYGNYMMYGSTGDTWLYLNKGDIYSSGIYCGTKILRTDGTLRVGTGTAPYTNVNKGSIEVYGVSTSISYVGVYGDGAGSGSQIYLQCETDGQVTLGSRGRNGTWYTILNRANNAYNISAHGSWGFDNGQWVCFNNSSGVRKRMIIMNSSNEFFVGYDGYIESFGATYFDGNAVYIRSKGVIQAQGNFEFKDYTNSYRRPVASVGTDGKRISYLQFGSATKLELFSQNGTAGSAATNKYNITMMSSSDVRLKENIEDTEVEALPVLNAIRMRRFTWKNDAELPQAIGMIADEVEKVDPRLVYGGGYTEDGGIDTKSIDTFYLMGYLVKAVQELSAEIEALKKKLN